MSNLISRAPKSIRTNTTVKRLGTPLYQAATGSMVWRTGPRVLANSPPKAGTHLVSSLLGLLPGLLFSGRHYGVNQFTRGASDGLLDSAEYDWASIRQRLARVRGKQFATSHFPADPELLALVDDLGLRPITIFRDPRDMAVSHAFYVRSLKRHPLHALYAGYPDISTAITTSIDGVAPADGRIGQPSTRRRLEKYIPWMGHAGTLVVRFEDLVGTAGGGSEEAQLRAVRRIAEHVGYQLSPDEIAATARKAFDPRSATFRRGQIGDWRNHFDDRHVELFKQQAGDLLIRLGYEKDLNW